MAPPWQSRDKPGLVQGGSIVALSGKSALSRGSLVARSLGALGINMHADDSGVSRGIVGAESGRSLGRSRRYS